jgi:hypothetical protein
MAVDVGDGDVLFAPDLFDPACHALVRVPSPLLLVTVRTSIVDV